MAIFYGIVMYFWLGVHEFFALFYSGLVALIGVGQILAPWFKNEAQQRKSETLGRYMAGVHNDLGIVSGMYKSTELNRGAGI